MESDARTSVKKDKSTRKASPKHPNQDTKEKNETSSPAGTSKKAQSKNTPASSSSFEYEFCGPLGALATMTSLPILTLVLGIWAHEGHVSVPTIETLQENLPLVPASYACLAYLSWFAFQVFLERVLPYEAALGTTLADGRQLTYRLNGHLAFWTTLLFISCGWPYWHHVVLKNTDTQHEAPLTRILQFGRAPLEMLYHHYTSLAFASIVFSVLLSSWLYSKSFAKTSAYYNPHPKKDSSKPGNSEEGEVPVILAKGGNSPSSTYNFFLGRELNPRILHGTFDLKVFCELRPGLILWLLLNLSAALQQYQTLGYITYSMMLINMFQGIYVWDALYQERAILTTMDITTDGFGYMLVFGDLAWVPFTYSLQARYLVHHDPHLHLSALFAIVACHFGGYAIFRGANGQKDMFRRVSPNHPSVKHLTYMSTKRGTKLLTSGWWGMARKINYTGDWIMGCSWCLLCGFESVVPYFYAIYFAVLLVHRSVRDDAMCLEKYGEDWLEYKRRVRYRFIPGVV